jgi:6-phosphogluconolactonase (cycloisomerase 2 family)
MHRYSKYLAVIFGLMIAATIGVSAQQFVYVVTGNTTNTVKAYSVSSGGALTEIAGSPFSTGGTGAGGFFAAVRATIVVANNLLYAVNAGSNNISAITINPVTGALTSVAGSPFATGETGSSDMSITATSQYLFVADQDGDNITVFSIGAGGVLTEIAGSPFSTGAGSNPNGIMVTPNGQFLIVTLDATDRVAVYSIAGSGALSAVAGSPFAMANGGFTSAGVDIMSSSNLLFIGNITFGTGTSVSVANIAANGALSEISGSPFNGSDAVNSNVVLLSPDERFLFSSNQASDEITVYSVAATGALTQISGSPFAVTGTTPTAMATNFDGSLLYVNNSGTGTLGVYSVASGGALTEVGGSPVNVGSSGRPGLASFPALLPDQRLPVELTGFSLSSGQNSVQLNWRTASEVDNAGFEIQRSSSENGGFRTIASYINHPEIAGLGTSPIGKSYSFTDDELAPGTYQYRLIDVSTDGARKVHPARTIRVESNEEIVAGSSMRLHRITPNPVNAEGQVSFALPEEMNVRIDLFSSDGNLVATPVANRNFGAGNHTEAFSTAELPAGTYVVLMTAGTQTRVQRLVVVH